ncbi:MAG: hypothetical protein OXH00_05305 [Candidatus Poribacteria bacterium]|nr:hypothetical protein [Candidatus Poribacteria bacterium]
MNDLSDIIEHSLPEFLGKAKSLEDKTIKRVDYGHEKRSNGERGNEVLILEFTDDTRVRIKLGSNAMEFRNKKLKLEELKLDFTLLWD